MPDQAADRFLGGHSLRQRRHPLAVAVAAALKPDVFQQPVLDIKGNFPGADARGV